MEVACNRHGLREREVVPEKRRGSAAARVELRKNRGDVRTVNCGAAGAICADEYS